MALVAGFLVDTSAMARFALPEVADRLAPLISVGLVATCAALDFEALFQSRSAAEYERDREERRFAYEYLPTGDAEWQRALDVQRELARQSRHRSVGMPDLILAAVAERHGVTLVHYDSDFDIIASVSGQSVEWVLPAGTVP